MGSIFVISDLHLGSSYSFHTDVPDFLEWLERLERTPREKLPVVSYNNENIVIQPPEKLILLGDILELWEPIDNEFKNTARHFFESIKPLLSLNCEIVYVTGNHDEAFESFADTYPLQLSVHKRHYPEDPADSLRMGEHTYFFLHGHQFDKLFRMTGPLSHFPTLNSFLFSLTKLIFPPDGLLSIPVLIFLLIILLLTTQVTQGRMIQYIQAVITVLASGVFILALSKIFTDIQNRVSKTARQNVDIPKYKSIDQIIEQQYYRSEKDTTRANTIVFGHTHRPEISFQPALNKTFINTGSWVDDEESARTILYINGNHHILLKWNNEKKMVEVT